MGKTNDRLRTFLEEEIDCLRIKENAVRHAFLECGDYLWIQLGGPVKAAEIQNRARHDRLIWMDLYKEIFGEKYLPKVFNELY